MIGRQTESNGIDTLLTAVTIARSPHADALLVEVRTNLIESKDIQGALQAIEYMIDQSAFLL